jgi:hypothetical protein
MGLGAFEQFRSQGPAKPGGSTEQSGKSIHPVQHTLDPRDAFSPSAPDESLSRLTSPDGNQQPEPKASSINTDSRK